MTERTYTIRKLRWTEICKHEPEYHTWIARGITGEDSDFKGYKVWKIRRGHWALRLDDNNQEFFESRKQAQDAAQAHFEATLKHYLKIAK